MIEIRNLSFIYPQRKEEILKKINLKIEKGEFVLLTGPTGCGKTTLLKCLNGIIPHKSEGKMKGEVFIDGENTRNLNFYYLCQKVGLVFQNPDAQIFSSKVLDEVAFGCENLNLDKKEIEKRVEEALDFVEMSEYKSSNTNILSGGQKQRIAIASVLSMKPKILALDEPLSQLDPEGSQEVLRVLRRLNKELGITIILVEHRIPEVINLIRRVIVMDKGEILLDEGKKKAFSKIEVYENLGLKIPEMLEIFHRFNKSEVPLTPEEGVEFVKKNNLKVRVKERIKEDREQKAEGEKRKTVLKIKNLDFSYQKNRFSLKKINMEVKEKEVVAIMGPNGSGKSTLLYLISGILKPTSGKMEINGKEIKRLNPYRMCQMVSLLFQNPDLMLLTDRVYDEVSFGPKNILKDKKRIDEVTERVLKFARIENLREDNPFALSQGQRLRVALASILSLEAKLLLLDEPTTGQDWVNIEKIFEFLRDTGKSVIFATHDTQTVLKFADKLMIMKEGEIISSGEVRKIFLKEEVLKDAKILASQTYILSKLLNLEKTCLRADEILGEE